MRDTLPVGRTGRQAADRGPFRHSRNPGYLSFAMIYPGISLLARSSWSLLLLPVVLAVIRVRVIEQEERYLEREFGREYLGYKARARRWI
ncbi:methyltransferase family protein [Rubrobacter tropicus]|uniref:methyltransferase family protein n=1 Tax=Rubrobacter tropicus TaxID=2653851 RepID=UPI001D18B23A|nr:isoprenylcysteine carboxylmethyltransferase family protein [Rubrobacter tropicus]